MSNSPLRLEQYDTILYNANLNPMGVPESVIKAISENAAQVQRYPVDYYDNLKKAIGEYCGCDKNHIVMANGSSDMLRTFISLVAPQKAMVLVPSCPEYENILEIYGTDIEFYNLKEEENYEFRLQDFVSALDSSLDMLIIGNPSNPTSQLISREDMETLADVCRELGIFLVIDEAYIEFVEDYEKFTCIPLVKEYDNIVILRSVSRFFAVPGMCFAYAVMSNPDYMSVLEITTPPDKISTMTAIACTRMVKDSEYIYASRSQIFTERNLIYSAMSTCKNIKLFKPYANFILVKILKEDISAGDIADVCRLKGLIIKTCENFRGLDDKYIRFCFMSPKDNDILVNTILEQLK